MLEELSHLLLTRKRAGRRGDPLNHGLLGRSNADSGHVGGGGGRLGNLGDLSLVGGGHGLGGGDDGRDSGRG